ncbi:MAG: hypothetical protein H6713_29550 [Myxococcales bacterium]|nr:hypothetical protein [Myxococcales bacterium]MCB9754108.1 hypothetical protein [Myxococcales bacterium]
MRALADCLEVPIVLAPPEHRAFEEAYQRARRSLFAAIPGQLRRLLLTNDTTAVELSIREREQRGPDAATASQVLLRLTKHPNLGVAQRCLGALFRPRAPELDELLRDILSERASPLRRYALARARAELSRGRLEPLARLVLTAEPDEPDAVLLRDALLILERDQLPIDERRLLPLLEHEDALVRRVAARVAERVGYQPGWPALLVPALLQHEPSARRLRRWSGLRGYHFGGAIPSTITYEPYTLEHRAAFLALREPLPVRRAIAGRARRCSARAIQEFADQLDAAELDHQRHQLTRALLYAARVKHQRHRLLCALLVARPQSIGPPDASIR